jgi:hypothetical protein
MNKDDIRELRDTIGSHYDYSVNISDFNGGNLWYKEGDYYYSLSYYGNVTKSWNYTIEDLYNPLPSVGVSDLSLFQMGILSRNEVKPIMKIISGVNGTNVIGDQIKTYTIDQIASKGDFGSGLDKDRDGIPDWMEIQGETGYKTNPLNPDSDGDRVNDYQEMQNGTNPLNPNNY